MAQQYDSISKYMIGEYSQSIAGWVLGQPDVEVEESLSTTHIPPQYHSDVNFKVRYADGTLAILHIEVQTVDSPEPMESRMAAYHGLLIKEHKMPVYGCVIYLHPNAGRRDSGRYAYQWAGGQYLMQYKVIRLIEMDGRTVLETQDPGLLAFSSLMKRPADMDATQWLDECVEVVGASSVAPRQQLVALGILSSLIYDPELIEQRIPEDLMHEFPLIQKIADEAETRGLERGERKATIESILALLGIRFNPDAVGALKPALETIADLHRLKELLLATYHVENLEAFMQTLHE